MTSTAETGTPRDRRRRAIVDAARALTTEHGPAGFTVDRVAEVAGVSRRTVFNHFAGLDDLLVAVCEQILDEVLTDLVDQVDRRTDGLPEGDAGVRAALDAVHEATRHVDLPSAIVAISSALGDPSADDPRADAISRAAFEHVIGRLRDQLVARAPGLDPVDLELTLTLLTSGLAMLAKRWLEDHPGLTPDVGTQARADWDRLLGRLLGRLRHGHAADVRPDPTDSDPHPHPHPHLGGRTHG